MKSQNNEEQLIADYFGNQTGTVLDIGANDGETLSNSYRLLHQGWQGCLVEPSPQAFERLQGLYRGNPKVHLFPFAIGNKDGVAAFYESGEHLRKGDVALLSTLHAGELQRWQGTDNTFVETRVQVRRFDTFLQQSPIKQFDLISIDAEGADYDILCQMDLRQLGCRMLIVEYNHQDQEKYLAKAPGYRLLAQNHENLILAL